MGQGSSSSTAVAPREAREPLILAIDVGTSSARALAYDADGRQVEGWEVHEPYPVHTSPDGGVVIDPVHLFEVVCGVLDQLTKQTNKGPKFTAVACDTFWHSLMGCHADGKPLTPVFTWADTRSSEQAMRLRRELDAEAVHARTGCVIHSSYWPAKLAWLAAEHPDTVEEAAHWMSFAEYFYERLFGQLRVSISMASATGLLDQASCDWDTELLEVLSVLDDKLSPLAEFTESARGLVSEYAKRWPALADIPWYLALGDGGSNNIGAGGHSPERLVVMIGTSGAMRFVRRADSFETPPGIWTYRIDRRRLVQGGALSDGGNVFAWLANNFRVPPIEQLEEELVAMNPDSHGLTVLPFLAGERSPDWDPDAVSAFVGMTLHTRAADVVRACLEAVAYRFAAVFEVLKPILPPKRGIIGSGAGLLHSPAWLQIMTDVLGEQMTVSAVPEASSRGAALLALEAMGAIPDVGAVPAPLGQQYVPDTTHHATYRRAIERQAGLYRALIPQSH